MRKSTRQGSAQPSARFLLLFEKVWGRYQAVTRTIAGVYSGASGDRDEFRTAQRMVAEFEIEDGRPPRILVAKMGQDRAWSRSPVMPTAFADLGFDVDIGPLFQTPRARVAQFAVESDVHVVGVSSLHSATKP